MTEPRKLSDAELVRHAHELIRSVANAEAFFHTDTAEYLTKKARRDEAEAELLRRLAAARPRAGVTVTISMSDARTIADELDTHIRAIDWSDSPDDLAELQRLCQVLATPAPEPEETGGE